MKAEFPPSFENLRYSRQLALPEIGISGQRRLAAASVLVVGAGGLGVPLLASLAGAGIGRIAVCEYGLVELSNLNRQFFYSPRDIGREKLELAIERLRLYQPDTCWQPLPGRLDADRAMQLLPDYDLVLAAADNRQTRLALNEACCSRGKTLIDAGVKGFNGYLLLVHPQKTACYTCYTGFVTATPETKTPVPGILGATAAVLGSLQAQLAIRSLLGLPDPPGGSLLIYQGQEMVLQPVALKRAAGCPVCSRSGS